MTQTG